MFSDQIFVTVAQNQSIPSRIKGGNVFLVSTVETLEGICQCLLEIIGSLLLTLLKNVGMEKVAPNFHMDCTKAGRCSEQR